MTRTLLFLLLGLTLALALPARAMMVYVPESELVSSADLIIVGTVVSETPEASSAGMMTGTAKTIIRADKILRGPAPDPIIVFHPTPPKPGGGMVIMDHGGFDLKPGDQRLFFLQRAPNGYTIIGGFQGMRQPDEAEKFVPMIEQFPYSAVLVAPVGPFFFDQPATVAVRVKNRSNAPITCYAPRVEAYFHAVRLGAVYFNEPPLTARRAVQPAGTVVPAGGEAVVKAELIGQMPAAWKIFPADSFLQAPAMVRARVFVELAKVEGEDPNKAAMKNFNLATAWATALIGFPPPAEAKP